MKSSANAKIFCNTPWYEAHIYWDGSLGVCCQESHKLTTDEIYNIKNIGLLEWFNSDPVKKFRLSMLGNDKLSPCSLCYYEEKHQGSSRRFKTNQKSVIFSKTAFAESFNQSPHYSKFEHSLHHNGHTQTFPVNLHIDLGNHCNLACKMCWPGASTTIASQYVKWGINEAKKYLGVDWTSDSAVWSKFLQELLEIPNLKNIHLMGGETLLSPKFEELVNWLQKHKKFDVGFSFVTNGTVFNPELISKLKQFRRVGIEISIETTTLHNNYIRQGSNIDKVLENINLHKSLCDNSEIDITVRPAISALSVGKYYTLLNYCLENKLLVKSIPVVNPLYLKVTVLPESIRDSYLKSYYEILDKLQDVDIKSDYNESNKHNYKQSIKRQVLFTIDLLKSPQTDPQELGQLIQWCNRWDNVYKFNVLELYPEFQRIWKPE